jgi:UDP-N-acetylmuramoyl-tripeptide--D-alanyl-D-alanine ligase
MKLTVGEILAATGGTLLCGREDIEITGVCLDSRKVEKGDIFVPVIGEKVDAHRFIQDVLKQGAMASFTSKKEIEKSADKTKALILVPDTIEALQAMAGAYRSRFTLPIVGITGSVGKTTTKEMVAAALETKLSVLKTSGNLNGQIGVALMLLKLEPEHEAAVIEMGMSLVGEMEKLSKLARPEMAVMTNIGVSHIGQLGSRENICKEKLRITDTFSKEKGKLFLNSEDALLAEVELPKGERIFYGKGEKSSFFATDIENIKEQCHFTLHYPGGEERVILNVLGEHNVLNALAAFAVAAEFGISPAVAKEGLFCYQPIAMRGQIYEKNGYKIIDDTYNASPDSMKSGVGVLLDHTELTRRFAVLADVLELGEHSYACHYEVGAYIAALEKEGRRIDVVVTVGQEAKAIGKAIEEKNPSILLRSFDTNQEAIAYLKENLKEGDGCLIKGSRGMKTDEIVEALR